HTNAVQGNQRSGDSTWPSNAKSGRPISSGMPTPGRGCARFGTKKKVSVRGLRVTTVQRGTESRAIAGGLGLVVKSPENKAVAGSKRDHLVLSRRRIPLQVKPQKTAKIR